MKKILMQFFFVIFFLLEGTGNCIASASPDFFHQRYRGWIWFEEEEIKALKKKAEERRQKIIEDKLLRKRAREEVEKFAKELEEYRYMMIRYPKSVEHMRAYKAKEKIMLDNAIQLGQTARLTTFQHPELVDHIENPINLYGKRIKEGIEHKKQDEEINSLSKKVELYLFFAGTCEYCKQLQPVLADFAKNYNFKVEAVSLDGAESKYFKTHHNSSLVKELGLEKVPTVIVLTNDGSYKFELIRGAASMTELKEMAVLASQHLQNIEKLMAQDLKLPERIND